MAVNIRQLLPLRQAKSHRAQLPRYLQLEGGRYLIAAALLLSLMGLLTLGQTGRLAAKGHELSQLQREKTNLLRERRTLQMELSEAQSLETLRQRAEQEGLRPWTAEQVRYMTVLPDDESTTPAPDTRQPTDDDRNEQQVARNGEQRTVDDGQVLTNNEQPTTDN
jgi:hypothetical protein